MRSRNRRLWTSGVILLLLGIGLILTLPSRSRGPGEPPPPRRSGKVSSSREAIRLFVVSGQVRDETGEGVGGVPVWALPVSGRIREGNTTSGSDGTFRIEFRDGGRVRILAGETPWFTPEDGAGKVVALPARSLVLRGSRRAAATLRVRVVEAWTGIPLDRFRVKATPPGGLPAEAEGGPRPVEIVVRLPPGKGPHAVRVVLEEPNADTVPARTVRVRAGDRVDVELAWPGEPGMRRVRGRVVDEEGRPLAGALVFFGSQLRARGDEPFQPFDPSRVKDGVRTGRDGTFEITGRERALTVWRRDRSPVSVPVDRAGRITLPPLGRIQGRILDASGRAREGIEVILERKRTARTDEQGRFLFEKVEAGVRGLLLPHRRYVIVRVAPGKTTHAEIAPGIDRVLIELRSGRDRFPRPASAGRTGVLVGLGRVGSLVLLHPGKGSAWVEAEDVIPGRYLLLLSSGHATVLRVRGPEATADFGRGALTVRGAPGLPVRLLPREAADPFTRLMAGRVSFLSIPGSGETRISPLPEGRWLVGVDETETRGHSVFHREIAVDVKGPGAVARIPPAR